jgi:hypothetical protein
MNKIPVFQTVGRSYAYAIGGYFRTLGVIWLPVALNIALTWYLMRPFYEHMAQGDFLAYARDPQLQRMNFLIQLVSLVVLAIVSVGITKEVLGLRKGFRFFYAGFGAAELRVIGGYVALFLLFIVFVIAFAIGIGITSAVVAMTLGAVQASASVGSRAITGLIVFVLFVGVWLALLFIFTRLSFLFIPATVAEKRIGILRSWELTRGNFWRIVAIGILVLLPLAVIGCVLFVTVFGADFVTVIMQHARDQAFIQEYIGKRIAVLGRNMPTLFAVSFIVNPIIYGLFYAPPSFAYQALVPPPAEAAPPAADESRPEVPDVVEEIINSPEPENH